MRKNTDALKLYGTQRWRRIAHAQLVREPLCRFCGAPATVCDHIVPHHGDVNAFWLNATQSLCATCHGRLKRQLEKYGYSKEIGVDGYPIDGAHPCYAREGKPQGVGIPADSGYKHEVIEAEAQNTTQLLIEALIG
jgi:hypothetical protein